MRKTTLLFAGIAFLAALSPAAADEGLWLFTHPPRKQLNEQYVFQLTDALLERLQKASVSVGQMGSGSFVSADGLVLTNHHVGLTWLLDLNEKNPDLVRDGFYARQRNKELRCAGLELRVVWSMQDVSAQVHEAVKPDMTPAQASKVRAAILRAIEQESRRKTGLASEAVALNQGGLYHLYTYKTYTDVRLVFAPEECMGALVDVCFFRAYENGKPAKTAHHLPWSSAAPANGDLVLISGYPGHTDRARTSADLEVQYGPRYFLRFKLMSRLNNRLAEFAKAYPEHERHARFEAFALNNEVGRVLSEFDALEKILGRTRAREHAEEALLVQKDPQTAKRRQQALDRIAACIHDNAELSQAHFFLESGHAFPTRLFGYARTLLRLADDSAKPDGERLVKLDYGRADRQDTKHYLLEPKTFVKELEIVKLAESLDLWVRYAGADAELAAKVLNGQTPQQCARTLVEGTQLDQVEVRKALMQGGRKAVADSKDTMLALARLVDPRSREVRQRLEERVSEPCRQAYAVLTRAHQQIRGDAFYPDAAGTLRLTFGKVQPYGESTIAQAPRSAVASLGDVLRQLQESQQEAMLPKNWQAARSELDWEAPILFTCSADGVPGSSGSPIVDRQGRLVGVAARGSAAQTLDYHTDDSGCGAVAARGILEVLDKVYRAAELVKELGGNSAPSRPSSPFPPPSTIAGYPVPPTVPSSPQSGSSPSSAFSPKSFSPGSPQTDPLLPPPAFDPTRTHDSPDTPSPPSLVNPFPPPDALLRPTPESSATVAAEKAASLGKCHKELVPALIKALKDSDADVRQAAATALENLGGEVVPALIEALQAKDKSIRFNAALVLGKLGNEARNAIPALIRALEDDDTEVRRQAARALATLVRDCRQAVDGPPTSPTPLGERRPSFVKNS